MIRTLAGMNGISLRSDPRKMLLNLGDQQVMEILPQSARLDVRVHSRKR